MIPSYLRPKPLLVVEGNIGTGKSTTCRILAEKLNLRLLSEPIDHALLQLFYDDPKRWGFALQMRMLVERWAMQISAAAETMIGGGYAGAILDCSIWRDLVFTRVLYADGMISDKEYEIYHTAVRNLALILYPPTAIIYLNARPETCLERVQQRQREQETGVTLEYLTKIHTEYAKLLQKADFPWPQTTPCINVPWDPRLTSEAEWDRTVCMIQELCGLA